MSTGNTGEGAGSNAPGRPTASDLRERFAWLNRFSDDELQQISFCTANEPLQDGELYFDISNPERGQIVGSLAASIPAGSCYVRRGAINEQTWQKLLGFGQYRQASF